MTLLSEAKKKFGKKIKKQAPRKQSKKMAKKSKGKKTSKTSPRRSNLINKIPVVRDIVNNPTVRKATLATGTVSLLTGLAALVPIPQVQAAAQNPIIRTGTAFLIGDAEGAALQFVSDRGGLQSIINIGAQSNGGLASMGNGGGL